MILRKGDENYLNLNKERNEENMELGEYNCGGYALGTLTWIVMRAFRRTEVINPVDIWDEAAQVQSACVDELVDYFEGLIRPIQNFEELKEDEFAVLFRIGVFDAVDPEESEIDDYHFIKRHHDGNFWHKPGGSEIQKFTTDPFDTWECGLTYNCPITIFAVDNKLY
jgi:hypothetical protein